MNRLNPLGIAGAGVCLQMALGAVYAGASSGFLLPDSFHWTIRGHV